MSDYTKITDFAQKDTLPSGNADKVAKGTEVDAEYDAIAIAVATKYDSNDRDAANGIAPLDASALVPSINLPLANTTTVGALETATSAEAIALSAANKIIVPSVLGAGIGAWGDLNAGMISDIQALADPGFDTVLGWDDSGAAAVGFTLGTGLNSNLGALEVTQADILLTALGDYDANDHIDHTTVTITAGTGLSYSVGGTDISADATIDVDPSGVTEITVSGLSQSADGFLMNDGGVLKVMPIDQSGVLVVNAADAIQTFALTDANTLQVLDSASTRIWTIPPNASVAFEIGTVILCNSLQSNIQITAATGVTLTSQFNTTGTTATSDTITAGGRAALIKVATNEWTLEGAIED